MVHRLASKAALNSEHRQHRMGAVIVKGGRVLSTGYNQLRPSKLIGTNTLHAEAHAVLKLLKDNRLHDLVGSDCYVTRFTRGGRVGMSRPCPHCMELLRSSGVRRVYFTTDNEQTLMEKL